MFVNISQLREKVEYGFRPCGDSLEDCNRIVGQFENLALSQVGLGSRVLTRFLDKLNEKQLVLIVSTLLSESYL